MKPNSFGYNIFMDPHFFDLNFFGPQSLNKTTLMGSGTIGIKLVYMDIMIALFSAPPNEAKRPSSLSYCVIIRISRLKYIHVCVCVYSHGSRTPTEQHNLADNTAAEPELVLAGKLLS